ncbi:MAG: hypothetical protein ACOC44_11760 [Promethearchaeia archaeon]
MDRGHDPLADVKSITNSYVGKVDYVKLNYEVVSLERVHTIHVYEITHIC